jgi:hypothetical protein
MAKVGYYLKDRQERYNLKRGWFVNAWRIVDSQGKDMFQPWANTKKEALDVAKELDITVIGEYNTQVKIKNYNNKC